AYDGLEQRIAELSVREELARIRPELDGNQIMRILGIPPGPLVGRAYDFMLELRITEGELGHERAAQELLRWAAEEAIPVPPPEPTEDGES
ncbi:MAG TPA: CCA tRNA nucleotidyltransferase, partial [Streptosporangiaceae bacterium]|nr:CCA tRNA nucleotidyltransferase [Streptosporangiaceae bacterium]